MKPDGSLLHSQVPVTRSIQSMSLDHTSWRFILIINIIGIKLFNLFGIWDYTEKYAEVSTHID